MFQTRLAHVPDMFEHHLRAELYLTIVSFVVRGRVPTLKLHSGSSAMCYNSLLMLKYSLTIRNFGPLGIVYYLKSNWGMTLHFRNEIKSRLRALSKEFSKKT